MRIYGWSKWLRKYKNVNCIVEENEGKKWKDKIKECIRIKKVKYNEEI